MLTVGCEERWKRSGVTDFGYGGKHKSGHNKSCFSTGETLITGTHASVNVGKFVRGV